MPFGLTNGPMYFQHLMNDLFQEFLDDFVICYLDDIVIYSKDEKQYKEHVKIVLEKFQSIGLYTKLEKCVFHTIEVEFLGYIISNNKISMDAKKIQAVVDWTTPKIVCDVQYFLGFANF